jgi:hypothetical protein
MATTNPQRPGVHMTVASGSNKVVNCIYGPNKVAIQAIGGTVVVEGTLSSQAKVTAGTATWETITLTSNRAFVDNKYTAIRFSVTVADCDVDVLWV